MSAPTCPHHLDTGMRRGQPCGRSLREGQDVCGYHTERSMAARRARATAQRQPQREAKAARVRLEQAAPALLSALKKLRDWSKSEYQSNGIIDAEVDAAIDLAEAK